MKIIAYLLLGLLVSGCKKNADEISYYSSGEIQEKRFFLNDTTTQVKRYYKEGALMSESLEINKRRDGEYSEFHPNGKLKKKGFYKLGKKRGWFSEYSELEVLEKKQEYVVIDTLEHPNQYVFFSNGKDTLKNESNFLSLSSSSDTVDQGAPYKLKIELTAPFFAESKMFRVSIGDFDSLYRIPEGLDIQMAWMGNDRTTTYEQVAKHKGLQVLRGIISEYSQAPNDSTYKYRHLYFVKEFYVK